MTADGMAYVGYCGSCGAMVAAIADEADRKCDVAKFVADLLRDGCTIGRVTDQQVRDGAWRCTTDCNCRFCEKRRSPTNQEASRPVSRPVANGPLFDGEHADLSNSNDSNGLH